MASDTEQAVLEHELAELQSRVEKLEAAEKALRRANRAHRALSQCNHSLTRATDESQFLYEICRIMVEVCGYRLAWIGYAEQDAGKTVCPVAHAGFENGYLQTVNVSWADATRGRGPVGGFHTHRATEYCPRRADGPELWSLAGGGQQTGLCVGAWAPARDGRRPRHGRHGRLCGGIGRF